MIRRPPPCLFMVGVFIGVRFSILSYLFWFLSVFLKGIYSFRHRWFAWNPSFLLYLHTPTSCVLYQIFVTALLQNQITV